MDDVFTSYFSLLCKDEIPIVLAFHFFACMWYLIAALHTDVHETWVYQRFRDHPAEGHRHIWFIEQEPSYQWLSCLYFVVTTCTTVGFGDVFPYTRAEMTFVIFLELFGAIFNAIVISEAVGLMSMRSLTQGRVDAYNRAARHFLQGGGRRILPELLSSTS